MDETRVHRGQEWLEHLMMLVGLPQKVDGFVNESVSDGSCWLVLDADAMAPDQVEMLIGADGSVLDSIQYLANTTLNLGKDEHSQQAYTVELDGYRVRRQEELQRVALEAADKVRATGEEVEIGSLSSAERRQMHTILKSFEGLETFSRGQEPDRRLVVRLLSE